MGTPDLTPLEAVEILEHPEKHLQGKISVQPSLLRGAPDCVGGKIGFSQEYWGAVNQAASYLRAIAAGEYKRVAHGRWVNMPFNVDNDKYGMNKYNMRIKCTNCGFVTSSELKYAHCPVCGALMEEKDGAK